MKGRFRDDHLPALTKPRSRTRWVIGVQGRELGRLVAVAETPCAQPASYGAGPISGRAPSEMFPSQERERLIAPIFLTASERAVLRILTNSQRQATSVCLKRSRLWFSSRLSR
jgi:hypothetical protein